MKNILFVASEAVPFIKTGGLADVVGALPKMIDKNSFDVRVILPNYTCINKAYRDKFKYITHFYMDMGYKSEHIHVGIMEYELEGIKYYFIDNEFYFGGSSPYSTFRFDIEKFCFFSKAVLAVLPVIGFKPNVIHCHDWQAGLVPVFLKTKFNNQEFFKDIKTIMTIHNLKFQGIWDIDTIKYYTALDDSLFTADKLEFYNDANMLKGGLVYADYITTVSKSYAEEIKTAYYGEGLDGLLRAKELYLSGILNGIDYDVYNPEKDKLIKNNYNSQNFDLIRFKNKLELQKELGLKEDKNVFMLAIVSRLTEQKGLDLVDWVIDRLCTRDVQFVVLGTGDNKYEGLFKHFNWLYPERVAAVTSFSEELAHRIYSSADAVLMPSKFEPCGLTQLISLRYGAVPIVRETGGLKDTVEAYNEYEDTGDGFSFKNFNADEMLDIIKYAKGIFYGNRAAYNGIIKRGMEKDFSWQSSAREYEKLYRRY